MKKTLLIHDTFLMKGGAERLNIEIAKILEADIATAVYSENCYDAEKMGFFGKIFLTQKSFKNGMLGFLQMKWNFFCSKKITKNYEAIFFSNEAISAVWKAPKNAKKYYYAHSISRHLFDLYSDYLKKVSPILRPAYRIMAFFLKKLYKKEIQKMDVIFVNSRANQKRIKQWFWRESVLLYPSVDPKIFQKNAEKKHQKLIKNFSLEEKKFFISFARLTHAKGIDKIIEAAKKLPEKKFLILFGPHDSQREEFMKMVGISPSTKKDFLHFWSNFPNIFFLTFSDNRALSGIISSALATLCMSKNEDFGMIAIESMACGTPVLAPREGGYLETIIEGKNGFFLSENSSDALYNFLKKSDEKMFREMRESSEKSVEKFHQEFFEEKLKNAIK